MIIRLTMKKKANLLNENQKSKGPIANPNAMTMLHDDV